MSVCDEGWGKATPKEGFGFLEYRSDLDCPCLQSGEYGYGAYCGLFLWVSPEVKEQWEGSCCWTYPYPTDLPAEPPDTCPHSAALRAVVENPEMVLMAVPDEATYVDAYAEGYDDNACCRHDEFCGRYSVGQPKPKGE